MAPQNLVCHFCGKTFVLKSFLDKHETNHVADIVFEIEEQHQHQQQQQQQHQYQHGQQPCLQMNSQHQLPYQYTKQNRDPHQQQQQYQSHVQEQQEHHQDQMQKYLDLPSTVLDERPSTSSASKKQNCLRMHPYTASHNIRKTKICTDCKLEIAITSWTKHLTTNIHKLNNAKSINENIKLIDSACKNRIAIYRYTKNGEHFDVDTYLANDQNSIVKLISNSVEIHTVIKFNVELAVEYIKLTKDDLEVKIIYHTSKMSLLTKSDNINEAIQKHINEIKYKLSEFQERDSGWTLTNIEWLEININKSTLIKGSSYIPTPKFLQIKKACINIKNTDEYCFKWCVIAALHNVGIHRERCSNYDVDNISSEIINLPCNRELNFKNLTFPLATKDIQIFERNNPDISINVFGYEKEKNIICGPYHITKEEKTIHINLLLLEDLVESSIEGTYLYKSHYVYVSDLSR